MKRCFAILLLISLLGTLLCACNANQSISITESAGVPSSVESHSPVSSFVESISEVAPSPAPESDPPISSEIPAAPETYTIHLVAAVQIFSEPDYDGVYVQAVGQDGVYTIVEESIDTDGNRWGKLKSGIGWVNLDEATVMEEAALTAGFTTLDLLQNREYHACMADTGEYSVLIAFYPKETLREFTFVSMELSGDEMTVNEMLFSLDVLTPEIPFVASVSFPGDMTTYGVSYKDADGVLHKYTAYISGRNGSLVFEEQSGR